MDALEQGLCFLPISQTAEQKNKIYCIMLLTPHTEGHPVFFTLEYLAKSRLKVC